MAAAFAAFTEAACANPIAAAIILGSGSNGTADRVRPILHMLFDGIPHLCGTSVDGHRGCVTLGDWVGKRVLVFEGRLHFYEGHSWTTVVRPVVLARELGARVVLLTNAAGGIHADLGPGSLMAIRDHILWNVPCPWQHPGPGALSPPRESPYSARLLQILTKAVKGIGVEMMSGVYASVTGPCYETPAEIRALRAWGADAVGMSTAREVDAAAALGMECAAVSCITNRAAGLSDGRLDHEDVLAVAAAQTERMAELIEHFLRAL